MAAEGVHQCAPGADVWSQPHVHAEEMSVSQKNSLALGTERS